jgi:hypothetical protein
MKVKIKNFLDTASRKRLITASCWLGLIGLGLMSWSLFDQGWIPVMAAMSVGQGIGTLSFALYLLVVIIELRQVEIRHSYRARQRERGDH